MFVLQNPTSGDIIAVEVPEKGSALVAMNHHGGSKLDELAICAEGGNDFHLEDVISDSELRLVQEEDGSWQLDGVTLQPADIEVSEDMIRRLPHRRLESYMKDTETGEYVAVIRSQSRQGSWELQAYVGTDETLLTKRGDATQVCREDQERMNNRTVLVGLGKNDIIRVVPDNPSSISHCDADRGTGRIGFGNDIVQPRRLTSLFPHHYGWEQAGADTISVRCTTLVS